MARFHNVRLWLFPGVKAMSPRRGMHPQQQTLRLNGTHPAKTAVGLEAGAPRPVDRVAVEPAGAAPGDVDEAVARVHRDRRRPGGGRGDQV